MQKKESQKPRTQGFTMQDRELVHVSGVEAVDRFDETIVILDTLLGHLRIDGQELHVQKLDLESGQVVIHGKIDAAVYEKTHSAKSFFERIFS